VRETPAPRCEDVLLSLRAIADAPNDALPRLGFADWLEEHGWPKKAAAQREAAGAGFADVEKEWKWLLNCDAREYWEDYG
jgi:uncharacterized protein (TIGR02996 family)